MAFLSKVGNILKQAATKPIKAELSVSRLSIFQAVRCLSSFSSPKLFVGGLSYSTEEQSLREAFSKYGEVIEARVIMDRETGRSRGFGFVTYASGEEASSAIQALDGQELHGRRVRVNFATDRARPNPGFGYGAGYGANQGSYGGGQGGFGSSQGYGGGQDGFGSSQSYGGGQGNYGSSQGYTGGQGGYGSSQGYGGAQGGYGSTQSYGAGDGSYGGSFNGAASYGGGESSGSFGESSSGSGIGGDVGFGSGSNAGGFASGSNSAGGFEVGARFDQDVDEGGDYAKRA